MSLLAQFPRLTAYDPGVVGEGGLDPLGLGAIADRLADVLVPGLRARMNQPRFVSLTAIGAMAYQELHKLTADEGKTTVDLAFEWLVVEAMVRHSRRGDQAQPRNVGLPGNEKAQRALKGGNRVSRRTYLNGPRVFGFTGIYRPFSRDANVLTLEDQLGENAAVLVRAWEVDRKLNGYVDRVHSTPGGKLRKEIAEACKRSLEEAECSAPIHGQLLRELSDHLAPKAAGVKEREALRRLVSQSDHEIRNDLVAMLTARPPAEGTPQRAIALELLASAAGATRVALQAVIDYEEAASALDRIFRRFLAFACNHHGAIVSPGEALGTPSLAQVAEEIGTLAQRAVDSVAQLGDAQLASDTADAFRLFAGPLSTSQFFDAIVERHEEVQTDKRKLAWLDRIGADWTVRTPYRNRDEKFVDEEWAHPMRLETLSRFLMETAT
ncbi:hypothetical protein J2W32_005968 [Variovorax boronicumulans]|uniref:Uncharacterized protein n=1 Tax=Variovorax boronicumulans TaxID=436515 RepID=A0AAW8D319_9BURK|nr:hypothetical protein [Variovorax boronicumulans]MDP9896782.1 hypothetical protein [Variovorax boronicumulans]MDQ0056894.1 hypothetical protein [Variovorax boronicumulans]